MIDQERGAGAVGAAGAEMLRPNDHERAGRSRPKLGAARMIPTTRDYIDHRCPACYRRLKIRAAYAGKNVACKACGGRFSPTLPAAWG